MNADGTVRGTGRRPRLLLVDTEQFGHRSDPYYYVTHLREEMDVTVVCWDYGRPRIEAVGVEVCYVSREGPRPVRLGRLLARAIRQSRGDYDIRYVIHFVGCGLLPLLGGRHRKWILDVRTAAVTRSPGMRAALDRLTRLDARFYDHLAVVSTGVGERLGLQGREPSIMPLGAVVLAGGQRRFDDLRLLYVGTLTGRDLEVTVEGLARFIESGGQVASYTIVGSGWGGEEEALRDLAKELDLADIVTVTGQIPHPDLSPYFENHNCGVAYIPLVPYYEHQPALKVFEYLLAGMPVIATRTQANEEVMAGRAGVLVGDSPDDFAEGLGRLAAQLETYDSESIRASAEECRWDVVVARHLRPFLRSTLDGEVASTGPSALES